MGNCISNTSGHHNGNYQYSKHDSEAVRSAPTKASTSQSRADQQQSPAQAALPRLDTASPRTLKKQRDLLFQRIQSKGSSFRTNTLDRQQFQAAYVSKHANDYRGGMDSWENEVFHLSWLQQRRPDLHNVAMEDLVALRAWTTQDYKIVQDVLEKDSEPTPEGLAYAKAITSGLHSLPDNYTHTGTVFTGEDQSQQWVDERHKIGVTASNRRFFATSETKEAAWQNKRVDWETNSLNGKRISALSYHPEEQEVLFPPGTKFRTDDVNVQVDANSEPKKIKIVQSEV